jgi:pyruvate dehydrogenase E1 component
MKSTGEKEMSTNNGFGKNDDGSLKRQKCCSKISPIIPDEARTFGMEGFFQKIGIYAHEGQKYEPVDSEQLSSYREDKERTSSRGRY